MTSKRSLLVRLPFIPVPIIKTSCASLEAKMGKGSSLVGKGMPFPTGRPMVRIGLNMYLITSFNMNRGPSR